MSSIHHHVTQRVKEARRMVIQNYSDGKLFYASEIVEKTGISESYLYKILESIAKQLGVSKNTLLRFPKTYYIRSKSLSKAEKADIGAVFEERGNTERLLYDAMSVLTDYLSTEERG